jgi:hypothetical protein
MTTPRTPTAISVMDMTTRWEPTGGDPAGGRFITVEEMCDIEDEAADAERGRLRAKRSGHLQDFLRQMSPTEHALIHDFADWLLADPEKYGHE